MYCPNPTLGNSCYFYFSTTATFADAQTQCQSLYNGYLVSYSSELEQRMIETRFLVSWARWHLASCLASACQRGATQPAASV